MTHLRALLREPLLHFILIGVAIVALYRAFTPPARVAITPETRAALIEDHRRRTGAAPTPAEEATLVARWVDDEAKVREAFALGLDRGDVIVRRRMLQKMEFVLESEREPAEPTAEELRAWIAEHPGKYTGPERASLEHVFVSKDREGADARMNDVRAALARGVDPKTLGDPFVRGREHRGRTQSEVEAIFGASFAARAFALPEGTWSEPIASPYGAHLVRVTERAAKRDATFDEAREAARRDLLDERKATAARIAMDELRGRWTR